MGDSPQSPHPQILPARPQQVFPHLQIGELLFVRQNNRDSLHPSDWPTERDTAQCHAMCGVPASQVFRQKCDECGWDSVPTIVVHALFVRLASSVWNIFAVVVLF